MCQGLPASLDPVPAAVPHICGCGGHGAAVSAKPEVGRRVPASHEMEMPEVPFPSARVLAVAGAGALRELVRQHHALLRKYSQLGVRCAFEMACSAADEPTRFGSKNVNDGIKVGKAAGAEFIDVYPPDLKGVK